MAQAFSSTSGYLSGPQEIVHAYLKGQSPQRWTWGHAYLAGSTDSTPDSTPAFLYGGGGVTDSTPAMVIGYEVTKTSRIPAYMYADVRSTQSAYLSGPT